MFILRQLAARTLKLELNLGEDKTEVAYSQGHLHVLLYQHDLQALSFEPPEILEQS